MSPEIVKQALDEGVHRGIYSQAMVEPAAAYLRPFEDEDEDEDEDEAEDR